jgi:hypothetical protein
VADKVKFCPQAMPRKRLTAATVDHKIVLGLTAAIVDH